MINSEKKKQTIEHLRKLAHGEVEPSRKKYGICRELSLKFDIDTDVLFRHFETWPEYTHNKCYPVPSFKILSRDPEKMYNNTCFKRLGMWEDNRYGRARRRLCLHIANEMEKEL